MRIHKKLRRKYTNAITVAPKADSPVVSFSFVSVTGSFSCHTLSRSPRQSVETTKLVALCSPASCSHSCLCIFS